MFTLISGQLQISKGSHRIFSLGAVVFARKYEQSHGLNIFGGLTARAQSSAKQLSSAEPTEYSQLRAEPAECWRSVPQLSGGVES